MEDKLKKIKETLYGQTQRKLKEVEIYLTEERFRLLLSPPSLILSGATFLGLDFGGGLGAGFDFLRAFGPKNAEEFIFKRENTFKYLKQITSNKNAKEPPFLAPH